MWPISFQVLIHKKQSGYCLFYRIKSLMHCMIFFSSGNEAFKPRPESSLLPLFATSAPHWLSSSVSVTLPGGEKLSPGRSSGWEPAADWWFSSFLNTASHSCGGKAAPGCFVVTSVSRTAGCLQREEEEEKKNLQFDLQRARLQHSFAAADPDPVIKTDQRVITPSFFYYYLFPPPPWLNTVHFVAACRL